MSIADLRDVLHRLCSPIQSEEFGRPLGESHPSQRSSRYVRFEPTVYPSVAAIDLRPRTDDHFGLAILEPAESAAWSLPELEGLAGPLASVPAMPGTGTVLQGIWRDPALPARGVLYIRVSGANVEEITVRSERV